MKVSRHPPHVLSSTKAAYFMGYRFLSGGGGGAKIQNRVCILHITSHDARKYELDMWTISRWCEEGTASLAPELEASAS
jgi:hypothetical protein